MGQTISAGQIKTPMVDKDGFLRREWYSVFQTISNTIVQTTTNTSTIISNESSTLFNGIPPIIAQLALLTDDLIPAAVPQDASLLMGDPCPQPINCDALLASDAPQSVSQWTPYTAAVTPAAGMTYTATSQDSGYGLVGQSCGLRVQLVGTIGGVVANNIAISLPLGAYGSQSISGYAIISSNNVPILGVISGSTVTAQRYDGANFALGSITIVLTGTWQTLQ